MTGRVVWIMMITSLLLSLFAVQSGATTVNGSVYYSSGKITYLSTNMYVNGELVLDNHTILITQSNITIRVNGTLTLKNHSKILAENGVVYKIMVVNGTVNLSDSTIECSEVNTNAYDVYSRMRLVNSTLTLYNSTLNSTVYMVMSALYSSHSTLFSGNSPMNSSIVADNSTVCILNSTMRPQNPGDISIGISAVHSTILLDNTSFNLSGVRNATAIIYYGGNITIKNTKIYAPNGNYVIGIEGSLAKKTMISNCEIRVPENGTGMDIVGSTGVMIKNVSVRGGCALSLIAVGGTIEGLKVNNASIGIWALGDVRQEALYIRNCSIVSSGTGIYASASPLDLENNTIRASVCIALDNMPQDKIEKFLNKNYLQGDKLITYTHSLELSVMDYYGKPVSSARVDIVHDEQETTYFTDKYGKIPEVPLEVYWINSIGKKFYNNYTIFVKWPYPYYIYNIKSPVNKSVRINLSAEFMALENYTAPIKKVIRVNAGPDLYIKSINTSKKEYSSGEKIEVHVVVGNRWASKAENVTVKVEATPIAYTNSTTITLGPNETKEVVFVFTLKSLNYSTYEKIDVYVDPEREYEPVVLNRTNNSASVTIKVLASLMPKAKLPWGIIIADIILLIIAITMFYLMWREKRKAKKEEEKKGEEIKEAGKEEKIEEIKETGEAEEEKEGETEKEKAEEIEGTEEAEKEHEESGGEEEKHEGEKPTEYEEKDKDAEKAEKEVQERQSASE